MAPTKTNRSPLTPLDIADGETYKIRTRRGSFEAVLFGPCSDGGPEFFVVDGTDGGFDIEYDGRGVWSAGPIIGAVSVFEVSNAK